MARPTAPPTQLQPPSTSTTAPTQPLQPQPQPQPTEAQGLPTPSTSTNTNTSASQKRKRNPPTPHIHHKATFRNPRWKTLHLHLITASNLSLPTESPPSQPSQPQTQPQKQPPQPPPLDPLTTHTLLLPPLTAYLGTTGSSIAIDIVKTQGREVWIRVPSGDVRAVRAGVSGWVGGWEGERVAWRVLGGGDGDGGDVFGW